MSLWLGQAWLSMAGPCFRVFMVGLGLGVYMAGLG